LTFVYAGLLGQNPTIALKPQTNDGVGAPYA